MLDYKQGFTGIIFLDLIGKLIMVRKGLDGPKSLNQFISLAYQKDIRPVLQLLNHVFNFSEFILPYCCDFKKHSQVMAFRFIRNESEHAVFFYKTDPEGPSWIGCPESSNGARVFLQLPNGIPLLCSPISISRTEKDLLHQDFASQISQENKSFYQKFIQNSIDYLGELPFRWLQYQKQTRPIITVVEEQLNVPGGTIQFNTWQQKILSLKILPTTTIGSFLRCRYENPTWTWTIFQVVSVSENGTFKGIYFNFKDISQLKRKSVDF